MSRNNETSLESDILNIGRAIFKRIEAASPSLFSMEYAHQAALNWLTKHEALKLRLFRFIDVLPELQDNAAIARHLEEYLLPQTQPHQQTILAGVPIPGPLVRALRNHHSLPAQWFADGARFACNQSARRFIAGSSASEAVQSLRRLRRRGMTFTLDVLGETVISRRVARGHRDFYIQLIEQLSYESREWEAVSLLDHAPWGRLPPVNISIKLSAIVTKWDPIDPAGAGKAVLDQLRPILQSAKAHGAFINIDMEHHAVKDLTLELYKKILSEPEFRRWPDCGIVIQSYLPDGESDMAALIDWARRRGTPITVRLVKGAYWDSETAGAIRNGWPNPLYTEKWESDASFERIAGMMLENADIIRPAFASHNVRSIAAVLAMESALNLPPRTLELQMLTGMGDPLKRAMVAMKQRVRVYTPVGDWVTGMAYLIRRLLENTANESFLRQSFSRHLPVEQLLSKPSRPRGSNGSPIYKPFIQDPDETHEMNPFENVADVDFSKAKNRQAMQDALTTVRNQFGKRYPAIIHNEAVETDQWHFSVNPSSPAQVVGNTAICDTTAADRAVAAAQAAFCNWSQTSAEDRAGILDRAAENLKRRRYEIAAWIVYEVGKSWREAQGDFMETVDYLKFYAREMRRLANRPRRRDYPGATNAYIYCPRGVVLVLSPFCFPTSLLTGMTAAALVTGNTVIVKPATAASVCAAKMINLLIEAGLPPGVLNLVMGPGETIGDYLVQHPGVDMIALTGSRQVGCRVMEQARRLHPDRDSFKHVLAEMGGKNAIIIDDDADLNEAVQATIASAFGCAGQRCTAASRVIVLNDVYEAYLSKLVEVANAIVPTAADQPSTSVGPLIDAAAQERAQQFVALGRQEARCVAGGHPHQDAGGGYYFQPTVFADVPPGARIAQEECLAPIVSVIRADSFEHAIEIANSTPYALVGGVYSRSPRNIEFAKRRFQVGVLYVNRTITQSRVDRQPFGGFNMSGLGTKAGGPDYLQQFTIPRTISENTMRHGFSPAKDEHRPESAANTVTPNNAELSC